MSFNTEKMKKINSREQSHLARLLSKTKCSSIAQSKCRDYYPNKYPNICQIFIKLHQIHNIGYPCHPLDYGLCIFQK